MTAKSKVQKQADEMISRLKSMSKEELDTFYQKFRAEAIETSESLRLATIGVADAKTKLKDREPTKDDDIPKAIFLSCLAGMVGGATLGGIFGDSMRELVGGAVLGGVYGSIFISLLSEYVYQTRPVTKVVQGIRKYALERKVEKLQKKQKVHKYLELVLDDDPTNDPQSVDDITPDM